MSAPDALPTPAGADASARPGGADLPLPLTRFVGRAHELEELRRLLGDTRLLTLTGAGGSGKTRLAREAAAHVVEGGTRVGWVDLAPQGDPALVAQEVAAALRVPDLAGASPGALAAAIGSAPLLLVLDSCEHLVDACAELVERLLRDCPGLRVLATSREALAVPGETAWLVPPLADGEATQLFVERARAALPSFALGAANGDAVRDICRRLDGIPLAIELAAARVRVLSPAQIAARLDDAFRLLTSGSRTALPRHRTLRGTMDWSYSLLSEREQALLQRLAVFAGSFSLEAAEAVCAGAPLDAEDILDGTAALVDKSLVVMEPGDGAVRYRLLETVRQYALERLTTAGDVERWRERHARFYLALAAAAAPHLMVEDQPALAARIGLEHDNLRAAAAWMAADPARGEDALRLADGIHWYWYATGSWYGTGQFREARRSIADALARATTADAALRGRALAAAGLIALAQGDWADARALLEESLALARAHGEPAALAFVLSKLGAVHVMLGGADEARRLLDESFAIVRALPPQPLRAYIAFWRGWAAHARGDHARAREMGDDALHLARRLEQPKMLAHASTLLGKVEHAAGRHAAARARYGDALRAHLALANGWGVGLDLAGLAAVAAALGRHADAARLIGGADVLFERIGAAFPSSDLVEREQVVREVAAALGAAFAPAYENGRALSMDDLVRLATAAPDVRDAPPPPAAAVPEAAVPEAPSPAPAAPRPVPDDS
ncbi:MAG TPA: tetratricopeptide repeat protein, partial [Gemmatimonadaceae bacterium]|nr:tetratricopeptide repeat protein [Gemmatimonadaceae bacterium]